jgi:hypothetical protein
MPGVGDSWKVDYNRPVSVVRIAPQFAGRNPLILRKRFPPEIKDSVLADFSEGVVNEDTGLLVGMSGKDFRKHLIFDDNSTGLAHLEAAAALPDLMRKAKFIGSHADKKPRPESLLKRVHRFICFLSIAEDGNYSVLLTVKEFSRQTAALGAKNPMALYHHRIEKLLASSDTDALRLPATTYNRRDVEDHPVAPPQATTET